MYDMIIDPYFEKTKGNPLWRVTTSRRLGRMTESPIQILEITGKSSLANHHKSTTWKDDGIIDRHFQKSSRNPPYWVTTSQRLGQMIGSSIHKSKSQGEILLGESPQVNDLDGWKDHRSTFPKSHGEILFGESSQVNVLDGCKDHWSTFQKSRRKAPWQVNISQRLERMIGSPIHNFKRQREILLGESPHVNDLDGWWDHRYIIPNVKEKSSLVSHHKSMTWTDDRIIDP